jgi:hypothetical protein
MIGEETPSVLSKLMMQSVRRLANSLNQRSNMKYMSFEQSVSWLTQRVPSGATIKGRPRLKAFGFDTFTCALPHDSGKKVALTKYLYGFLKTEEQVLVFVRNWQVFPSSAHVPLMLRLRQALGEAQSLAECPGHLLSKDESDDGISLMLLCAEFFWDCFVLGASGKTALFISHDEYFEFYTQDPATLVEFKRLVTDYIK